MADGSQIQMHFGVSDSVQEKELKQSKSNNDNTSHAV